jgi:hypothetical protein
MTKVKSFRCLTEYFSTRQLLTTLNCKSEYNKVILGKNTYGDRHSKKLVMSVSSLHCTEKTGSV